MRMDVTDVAGEVGGPIDHGSATLTVPNASGSATVVITHKLGRVPRRIVVAGRTVPFGAYAGTALMSYAATASDFTVYGFNLNGYTGGVNVLFDWVALA